MGISSVSLSSDSPAPGKPLTVNFDGKPDQDVSGGTAKLDVKAFGVTVATISFDVCKDMGITCPLKSGAAFKASITYTVPAAAPSGIKATCEVAFTDTSGKELSCVDLDVTIGKLSNGLLGQTYGLSDNDHEFLFEAFRVQHKKKYGSAEEAMSKFAVFKQNLAFIRQHNADYEQGKHTYTTGMNHMGDMTNEEYKSMLHVCKGKMTKENRAYTIRNMFKGMHKVTTPAATSIDWTTKGAVTPVKNQQQCGSCWAFSTTGSTEGVHQIATGKLVSLSEQQLVDCSKSEGNMGCNGGLMDYGFEYIQKNGICTEKDYPYKAADGTCKTSCKAAVHISGHKDVPSDDEDALASAVSKNPVSVAIEADQSGFQFYSGGVFSGTCGTQLDHGVLVVGYGTQGGKDYWKVKNSWGATWGSKGYILMAKGTKGKEGQCGIAHQPSYPVA
jgi:C1A family cysteine protease